MNCMATTVNRHINFLRAAAACAAVVAALVLSGFCPTGGKGGEASFKDAMADTIGRIVEGCPGEVGVAVIINDMDTVVVGNRSVYPMMSVFKLHQALAVCDRFDKEKISLDSVMNIERDALDPYTWSPMLKVHPEPTILLTVNDLLRYTLMQSDNNASNIMFARLASVAETDSLIAAIIQRESFRIACTEAEMSACHAKAYSNYTSLLGAAVLMNKLFTQKLISTEKQDFIKRTLGECLTGTDRIVAPLLGQKNVRVAHKTGSGYTHNGVLAAHNDVAYISLPDGTNYALAVFVKDFKGCEAEASQVVARISAAVYRMICRRAEAQLGKMQEHTYCGLSAVPPCPGANYRLTIRNREHSGDGTFELTISQNSPAAGESTALVYRGRRYTQRGIPGDGDATVWQCVADDGRHVFNFLLEADGNITMLTQNFERPQAKPTCHARCCRSSAAGAQRKGCRSECRR